MVADGMVAGDIAGKTGTTVAVIFGGRSSEHAISCVSAAGVMGALEEAGYRVVPVGITTDGRWVLTNGDRSELAIKDRALPEVKGGTDIIFAPDPTRAGVLAAGASLVTSAEATSQLERCDVVFPVLHGSYGEDGTIQGLLELAGVPYVGAGVLASAVGMDKEFTKKVLTASGLPVGPYVVLRPGVPLTREAVAHLGTPVFVKPARAGSSVGVSKATSYDEIVEAVEYARQTDPKVVIEKAIVGREIECGVLQSRTLGARPDVTAPAEIRVVAADHDWYDFEAKYLDDACEFDIPANISDAVAQQIRELAADAFQALDCAGLARADFFVADDGDDAEIFINELNTMPGFTPISMFPQTWAASGVSYADLVDRLVQTALANGTGLR